jgi:hypothetical protein
MCFHQEPVGLKNNKKPLKELLASGCNIHRNTESAKLKQDDSSGGRR